MTPAPAPISDFEQGSIATANVFLAWLGRTYGATTQRAALVAWEAGDMFPKDAPPSPAPQGMTRQVARQQGFTGDQCSRCSSMRMKRSGTCATCEDCGTTTGCA